MINAACSSWLQTLERRVSLSPAAEVALLIQTQVRNRLLAGLSAEDFTLLAPSLTAASYDRGQVLTEPNAPMMHVIFPESGMVSVVARTPEGHEVEAGVIGREGFVHPASALDVDRVPYLINVQIAAEAYWMQRDAFIDAIESSASLRRKMLRFSHAYTVQTSYTVLSSSVHSTEERLARWLLMCHDRSEGDDVCITHEFLALMLSVRRPTVTNALHLLEGYRFIRCVRGIIHILHRQELQNYASDIYGIPECEYERVLAS